MEHLFADQSNTGRFFLGGRNEQITQMQQGKQQKNPQLEWEK
jgi:hypothetical protein